MQCTTLGRTGIKVSVAGLGGGGNSKLGQGTGLSEAQSVALVREALDLGVTFIDTAEVYGTEAIIGKAIRQVPRDHVVLSSKSRVMIGGRPLTAAEVIANLETSLRVLGTEYIDVFHAHAVTPAAYPHARDVIAPALLKARAQGKIRHLGITESSPFDHAQEMLPQALTGDLWDVVMFAFHMLGQNARRTVFPATRAHNVGTLLMFVVRNIFSRQGLLAETIATLIAEGKLDPKLSNNGAPLDFLLHKHGAASIVEAAYRFARHEPGAHVVLFGTGSSAHLKSNIAAILKPPLPADDLARLARDFGHLRGVGLDLPGPVRALASP